MGVIEKGSISGVLPSTSGVFAVHYPGYPSSTERAIETLGGSQGIVKVRSERSKKLELHFRPEDPYSHPAFGELQSCTNFLLKISKKKIKDVPNVKNLNSNSENVPTDSFHLTEGLIPKSTKITEGSIVPESESVSTSSKAEVHIKNGAQVQLSANIVSSVFEAYHFNGMVDYQHVLAVHADATRRKKRSWAEVEQQHENGGLIDVDQDDLMILVPPLFALKDLPERVVLKPCGDPTAKKKREEVNQPHWEMEIEDCLAIDFNIKGFLRKYLGKNLSRVIRKGGGGRPLFVNCLLNVPKEVPWEKFIPSNSERWRWQTAVRELFIERSIWVKSALAERLLVQGLNIGNNALRRLLYIAAYYFSNGPYLRFWIRKGYDPRKDPESRIYQKTDFRVPPSLRSYCDTDSVSRLYRWEDMCSFRVFPRKCQTSLQLFELKDDYIQQEIRKSTTQESCSLQTGWFSSQQIDSLRLRVAQRFLSIYPEAGAESLLKSVSNRFEKSKRVHLNVKDLKADGERKQSDKGSNEYSVSKAEVAGEDKETNDEIEYEEEEDDELEDYNLGEDVDEDEELDLVDQDRDLLPDLYTDHENASKDYLQELFGSFPFGAASRDDMIEDNDSDDGEYQIYEQLSDDNYSDDEN